MDNKSVIGLSGQGFLSRYRTVNIELDEPFIFHSSYYRYCRNPKAINVTTVHDFTYEYFRHGLPRWVHCKQKYMAIRHSEAIVCISENTKHDVMKFLPDITEEKIKVIYNGVSEDYYKLSSTGMNFFSLAPNSYVIYVGARSAYKNFELCVKALRDSHFSLVIVGQQLTKSERTFIRKYLPDERVHVMGFVSNRELNLLYNHAAGLVYPSSYEGFGIPVVEAQRAGCPVIAYNSSSIPEVLANKTLLMDILSEREMVEKLKLLENSELMRKVIDDGCRYAGKFSWDSMAEQYIRLYKKIYYRK